jgi:hypothetical protein
MTEQLSLFEGEVFPGAAAEAAVPEPEADSGAVDEIFRSTARWHGSSEYAEMLEFIARFPGYSPLNAFLLFVQDPEAAFIATAKRWSRRYRRRLKPGARPLVILAPMSPVLFVYDVRDTEGQPLAADRHGPSGTKDRLPARVYENTLHNCGVQHISVRETGDPESFPEGAAQVTPAIRKRWPALDIETHARYLILMPAQSPLEEKYAALVLELAHLFCGHLGIDSDAWWADRKGLELALMELEAGSAAFLVCRRRGLDESGRLQPARLPGAEKQLPRLGFNAVLQAASHIEAMGKAPWRKPRRQGRY